MYFSCFPGSSIVLNATVMNITFPQILCSIRPVCLTQTGSADDWFKQTHKKPYPKSVFQPWRYVILGFLHILCVWRRRPLSSAQAGILNSIFCINLGRDGRSILGNIVIWLARRLPAAIEIHKMKWGGETDKYINSQAARTSAHHIIQCWMHSVLL